MNVKSLVRPWIHSLDPYPPGKPIDELEREYGVTDSIKLASNENPLGPSPKALAALRGALADIHRYPDGSCYHLKRGLARKLRVSPESLIFGNGSNEIIELVVRTFLHALHIRGVPSVHLSMLTTNTPARAFYDRLGFGEIEVPDPGPVTYLGRTTADR